MASSDATTVDEIRAAVQKIEKAFADQDVATIEGMYAPDHISIAARYGGALRMPEQLETIAALKRTTFDVSLLDVRMLSTDAAMVTYEESYSGTYEGPDLAQAGRRLAAKVLSRDPDSCAVVDGDEPDRTLTRRRPMASREAATVDEIKAAVLELEKGFVDQDVEAIRRLASPDHISQITGNRSPWTSSWRPLRNSTTGRSISHPCK